LILKPLCGGEIEASIKVSTITAVVVGIVDVAPDVRRIVTAAVVVGIITVDRSRTYRQRNARATGTRSDRHTALDDLGRLYIGPPVRVGSGRWRNAEEVDRQQASHQQGYE
jgi:hypothetical protein